MDQYKVTVLGARKVGKTALVHYMTNMSPYGPMYQATKEMELRHLKLTHADEEIGQCSVALEDTPGFKSLDRANNAPELLDPKIMYMWCDDGVRKPGAEDPNKEEADEKKTAEGEKTPLVGSELTGVSPIDSKLDRQGFIIVYNPYDKDSFTAAQELVTDLQEKMKKPEPEDDDKKEPEPPPSDEDPPELPPYPFVVVATHGDLKNKEKKNPKNFINAEDGEALAQSVGGKFFSVNGNGRNVRKALDAVVALIHQVEINIVYDREPTRCERLRNRCSVM